MSDIKVISSVREMRDTARLARSKGKSLAFVPTMGFLHEGHASLMREGRSLGDILVTSIFVNPTQFGAGEDFESYPRDLGRDLKTARDCGVDIIFAPTASEMYPKDFQTWVNVEKVSLPLCGASRPGHFRGVTTVVCKLFNILMPTCALFGEKDFQQLTLIRRMVADLNMDVVIIGMPTVRETDGLAMSSRNAYLSADERKGALCLSRALDAACGLYRSGESSADVLRNELIEILQREPSAKIDYAELRDAETLEEVSTVNDRTVIALAARIGATRLIDNVIVGRGITWKEKC